MKFLAIDIGKGTQDIMLYDDRQTLESAIKLVVPSPTVIFSEKINKTNQHLYLNGETMGGGPVNWAIKNHLKKGYQVSMTEKAARTIRDDLNRVQSLGINILNQPKKIKKTAFNDHHNFKKITLKDIDLDAIASSLSPFNLELDFDWVGVAVQDHGFSENMGDRNFRFLKIKEKLNKPRPPEEFAYVEKVPDHFTRMNAVKRTLKGFKSIVMDSKFAAVCVATCDKYVQNLNSYVVMDVGNGHTMAASIENKKIKGVFEHHTNMLTPEKIIKFVEKLVSANLTNDEIYNDGGHGAWVLESIDKLEKVILTGPRRKLAESSSLPVYNAAPAGDVMMSGPAGLIKCMKTQIR